MANNLIQIKRTSVSGRAANTTTLPNPGELALNMTDGIMYSTNGSVVFEIGANTTNSKVTGTLDANVITVDTLQILGGDGTQGTITWNADEETIDIIQNGATLQVGQEIYYHVKNQSGNIIPDGTAVMATGTLGSSGRITVAPMVANGSVASRFYLGVTTEEIADGDDGKVTHFGKIRGLDLTAYNEGDVLWLDPSTPGGFITTEPEAPNLKISTAFVISNTDPGTMMVRANPGFKISDLHDVEITSATNNQFIVYDSVDGRWENRTANTTIVEEGDNLYYTVSRANSAIDARVTKSFVDNLGVNANTLDSLDSSQFLRSDVDDTATGDVTFTANLTANTLIVNSINAAGSLGAAGQLLSVDDNGDIIWTDVQETNVLYVSKDGSDTDPGTVNRTYLTIKEALSNAVDGDTIKVSSGVYTEDNPLTVPVGVSIIGDSLRNVTVIPANTTADVFWLNNGSYVTEITIKNYVAPAAAFAFPDSGAGAITRSPYVLNCTSLTTDGIGLLVDGSKASGNRSIIAGLYTIINQGGIGVKITNRGYSQLVNIYTIATDIGVLAENGGFCTLNCSDNSFGNYGLIANGTSSALYSGDTLGDDQFGNQITITGLSQVPYINNVLKITGDDTYYTVIGVTPLVSNTSTVTVQERITTPVANNTSVDFFQRSYIAAAGHAFEYVGTGTNLANASPFAGGIVNSNNQAISVNGGVVNYTSTDQFGNFNINNNLSINGINATIEGDAFQRSLFGLMTPYILAIEGGT
jgi:hypothetical protein